MENGRAIYSIEIENVNYKFTFDSNKLSTLTIVSSDMNIKDLGMLSTKSYECYVLMAKKRVEKNGDMYNFNVSAIAYRHMLLTDDNGVVTITFSEEVSNKKE